MCLGLTPNQAANIIKLNVIESPELVEICEKLVGNGIEQIKDQPFGTSNMLDIMDGFFMQEHSRGKIIQLLSDEIIEEVKDLSPKERCKFAFLLRNA